MDELQALQEKHREILLALTELVDIEKTVSRLRNELHEMDEKIQEKMNGE